MSVNAAVPFGLFETLRCVDGAAPLIALHQRRLASSWPAFFRGKAPSLARVAASAIAEADGALVRVRFLGEAGGSAVADVEVRALPAVPRRIAVAIATQPRGEARAVRRHKSADRGWADTHAVKGAFETLVWDEEAGLLEGTRTNLFVVVGRELSTPAVELGLVPGVVRARLLERAPKLGFAVQERPLAPGDLKAADGLLLTGSGVGVVAVSECDGRPVAKEPSASRAIADLARQLAEAVFAAR